jgi:hypothetical protein
MLLAISAVGLAIQRFQGLICDAGSVAVVIEQVLWLLCALFSAALIGLLWGAQARRQRADVVLPCAVLWIASALVCMAILRGALFIVEMIPEKGAHLGFSIDSVFVFLCVVEWAALAGGAVWAIERVAGGRPMAGLLALGVVAQAAWITALISKMLYSRSLWVPGYGSMYAARNFFSRPAIHYLTEILPFVLCYAAVVLSVYGLMRSKGGRDESGL